MSHNIIHHSMGQNLCSPSCPVDHIGYRVSKVKQPRNGVWPDIRGLNSLQLRRDAWLNRSAIDIAIREIHQSLPPKLQARIDLAAPEVNNLFTNGPRGNDALFTAITKNYKRFWKSFKEKEYSIWPVCVNENHWVLVVMHKELVAEDSDRLESADYSHIAQMAILDPQRKKYNYDIVNEQIRRLLEAGAECTFAKNYERKVWVPLQRDTTSCGPRCYWAAKQILDHLLDQYETGHDYHETLWADHQGWFNEDFVRNEMIGRNATKAVRDLDYGGRVAVELVNQVRPDGVMSTDDKVPWQSAADSMRPPSMDPDKEPEKRNPDPPQAERVLHKHKMPGHIDTAKREFAAFPSKKDERFTKGPVFAMGQKDPNPFRPPPPPRSFPGVGTGTTFVNFPGSSRPAQTTSPSPSGFGSPWASAT